MKKLLIILIFFILISCQKKEIVEPTQIITPTTVTEDTTTVEKIPEHIGEWLSTSTYDSQSYYINFTKDSLTTNMGYFSGDKYYAYQMSGDSIIRSNEVFLIFRQNGTIATCYDVINPNWVYYEHWYNLAKK